ncbi:MAG: dihydrofolate reductase [Paludibacteraceae bacterium]|nr:dihydrofolate reductase [Paludibacteraceae bacterium]
MKRLLVTYAIPSESLNALKERFEVIVPEEGSFSREEVLRLVPNCEAMLSMFSFKVDREVMDAGKSLKIISNFGVGYNNIDISYAKERGIVVTNTPDPVVEPTAELAFALMSDLARRVSECDAKLKRRDDGLKWGVMENLGVGLWGKRLGIVGLGNIGKAIARRALVSGMEVVYYNRHPLSWLEEDYLGVSYLPFEELLATSDYLSLNTPLTESTFHLMDQTTIAQMKRGAFLINTARGPVVDEAALVSALRSGHLAGAGLDVYEFEPAITDDLLTMDNVVLVPHIGTATMDARIEMGNYAAENILLFFRGEEPLSVVVGEK